MELESWGRLTAEKQPAADLSRDPGKLLHPAEKSILAYGMGRSYGDVCLNPGGSLRLANALDRFISFDMENGELVCEAGVLISDIQQLLFPKGWCLPVTPGTQFVTVGGAVANDVHGKNHHQHGCFSNHINWLVIERTNGEIITCSPSQRSDWFSATCGGLGLTGVLKQVSISLKPTPSSWMVTETLRFASIEEFSQLNGESVQDWEYTVSWIDCRKKSQKRGVFIRANHCTDSDRIKPRNLKLSVPFVPPFSAVNRVSVATLNTLYYAAHKHKGLSKSHYQSFYYPLDNILNWNRMYGPRGFFQYQLVVPTGNAIDAINAVLTKISESGQGSFLSVLKAFGAKASPGLLSFPMEGMTLALDFPNRGDETLRLFEHLDNIVSSAGGRLYPAKDARMPSEVFSDGYSQLPNFMSYRDPGISSGLSQRLMGW